MRIGIIGLLAVSGLLGGCSGEGLRWLLDVHGGQPDATTDLSTGPDIPGDSEVGATDLPTADQAREPDGGGSDLCLPDCVGRECGDDGCGGSCGKCPQVAPICNDDGLCQIECIADCTGRECGDDGCGGSCGKCPQVAPHCVDHKCSVDCTPVCTGMECGDDGCGGSCGSCLPPESCLQGKCLCTPACAGKECGDDGCGGSCGECAAQKPFCQAGKCVGQCQPDCAGKECGDDGCGGSCGLCKAPNKCNQGQCLCFPNCPPSSCGSDGCGGSCGPCACDELCVAESCQYVGCGQFQCGKDGCGKSCGSCPAGTACENGYCVNSCLVACQGKECGADGCGGFCGTCPAGLTCTDFGKCMAQCVPSCTGKECGSNGCGGTCGTCSPSKPYCNAGHCQAGCSSNCQGKVCGSDGCGGSCGICTSPYLCTAAGTCGGVCSSCSYLDECFDIDFSQGSLAYWNLDAAYLVTSLGQTTAPTGGYMLKLTTGEGITELHSQATFQNCLPPGSYMLQIKWKLYSEEFKEWCGSNFNDSFQVSMTTTGSGEVLTLHTIDGLCAPGDCAGCGTDYQGLVESDIVLDQGDVWNTPWVDEWIPIQLKAGANFFTLTLATVDAGDGIFDTVALVDRVRFVPCDQACEFIECGPNPCGSQCGSCGAGGLCLDGSCCYPSCAGKECGDDGCGGSCGACGTLSLCQAGKCKCKYEQCSDGCCGAGELCAAVSGKCCQPNCLNNPCGADGCGTFCPAPAGTKCCKTDPDCNDGDNLCTIDKCIQGICYYTASGNPGCCQPFSWVRGFENGTPEGFELLNSGVEPFPGMGISGWSVTNLCGAHSGTYSLYYGMVNAMFGNCVYDIGFPMPMGSSGTATSPQIQLPAQGLALTFWLAADIAATASKDKLQLDLLTGSQTIKLWDKVALGGVYGPQWKKWTIDLSAYASKSIRLRWTFETAGGAGSAGKGILLDDIEIVGLCGP